MRNLKAFLFGAGMAAILLSSCGNNGMTLSGLDPARFDTTINEKPVKLYTLTNKNGMEVCITNFGGRIVSVMVPDKNGSFVDVVLGYDNIAQYADSANSPSDYGATIGRYANRINKGQMVINNEKIQLPTNNFGHCLHGGPSGWQYQVYDAEQIDKQTKETPYGVPYRPQIWGAGWDIQSFAFRHYFLAKAYPKVFSMAPVWNALNFVLGCHPGSNSASFASGVGATSATVAYGANRADWSYIPGGVVSGTALIRPDFPELLRFPFLWQQTEYCLGGASSH